MRNFFILAIMIAGLSGCADTQIANDATNDFGRYTQLERNITTKKQLYELFGQPSDVAYSPNGESEWDVVSMKLRTAGATYVPIVGLFAGGSRQDIRVSTFQFDKSDRYENVETKEHSVYENMWVMLGKAGDSFDSEAFKRVETEMKRLGLPYDKAKVVPPELYTSPK